MVSGFEFEKNSSPPSSTMALSKLSFIGSNSCGQCIFPAAGDIAGRALIDGITADVLRFCDGARPHDDMTLMCLSRRVPGAPAGER